MKFTRNDNSELTTTVNGRTFDICGDSSDDYYSVYGATKEEVAKYQLQLDSCRYARDNIGRFKKLRDSKKFVKLVLGEI